MFLKLRDHPGRPKNENRMSSFATVRVTPFNQFVSEFGQLLKHYDVYAIVFILAIVYSQVKWILSNYTEKLVAKTKRDVLTFERIYDEVEQRLRLQEDRFAMFQEEIIKIQDVNEQDVMNIQKDVAKRLTFLEGLFRGLATSEHKLQAAAAAKLRHQLKTDAPGGKKLTELQSLSKAADEREHEWLKVVAYSPV